MRRICVLLPFVFLLVGFAPAPFPRAERRANAVNEMIGAWGNNGRIFVVTQDRMTHSPQYDYALKIDPRATPKTYDLIGVGLANRGWEFRGIYKIEGDTLTRTYNKGTTRPTSFEGQGRGTSYHVHKRQR